MGKLSNQSGKRLGFAVLVCDSATIPLRGPPASSILPEYGRKHMEASSTALDEKKIIFTRKASGKESDTNTHKG